MVHKLLYTQDIENWFIRQVKIALLYPVWYGRQQSRLCLIGIPFQNDFRDTFKEFLVLFGSLYLGRVKGHWMQLTTVYMEIWEWDRFCNIFWDFCGIHALNLTQFFI